RGEIDRRAEHQRGQQVEDARHPFAHRRTRIPTARSGQPGLGAGERLRGSCEAQYVSPGGQGVDAAAQSVELTGRLRTAAKAGEALAQRADPFSQLRDETRPRYVELLRQISGHSGWGDSSR